MTNIPMTYEEYKQTAEEMFIKYCKDLGLGNDEKYQKFFEEVEDVIKGCYDSDCHDYTSGKHRNAFTWHGLMGHVVDSLIFLYGGD